MVTIGWCAPRFRWAGPGGSLSRDRVPQASYGHSAARGARRGAADVPVGARSRRAGRTPSYWMYLGLRLDRDRARMPVRRDLTGEKRAGGHGPVHAQSWRPSDRRLPFQDPRRRRKKRVPCSWYFHGRRRDTRSDRRPYSVGARTDQGDGRHRAQGGGGRPGRLRDLASSAPPRPHQLCRACLPHSRPRGSGGGGVPGRSGQARIMPTMNPTTWAAYATVPAEETAPPDE